MGQGKETKTRSDTDTNVEIQERGDIFFFYRPKVGKEEAHGAEDVQRFYLVLRPHSGETHFELKQNPDQGGGVHGGTGTQQVDIEQQPLLRFVVMGRKSLPDPSKKSTPYWGFVEMVTTKIEHVKSALEGEEYETATRGQRHLPNSRAVGEGAYRILRHNPGSTRMHTHLVYKLEYPADAREEEAPPQEAFNIARQASFLLQIKNPDQQQVRGLQKKKKAAFPAHLQGIFGHKKYHPADPLDFLNYEGCEFLLISASNDIEHELGLELETEVDECCDLVKTFGESEASTRPLLEGTWV